MAEINEDQLADLLLKFISNDLENVKKLKKQMDKKQALRLVHLYSRDEIRETLLEMENHLPLARKYSSVSLTLEQWIKLKQKKAALGQRSKMPVVNVNQLFTYQEALDYCHKAHGNLALQDYFDSHKDANGKTYFKLKRKGLNS